MDFNQIVELSRNDCADDSHKSVKCVLSSTHNKDHVIASQYEANEILATIWKPESARLSIYAPRVTKPMHSFEQLDLFVLAQPYLPPDGPMTRYLELFSGSLYFHSLKDYKNFRYFLGLHADIPRNITDGGLTNEGFDKPSTRQGLTWPLVSASSVWRLPSWVHLCKPAREAVHFGNLTFGASSKLFFWQLKILRIHVGAISRSNMW